MFLWCSPLWQWKVPPARQSNVPSGLEITLFSLLLSELCFQIRWPPIPILCPRDYVSSSHELLLGCICACHERDSCCTALLQPVLIALLATEQTASDLVFGPPLVRPKFRPSILQETLERGGDTKNGSKFRCSGKTCVHKVMNYESIRVKEAKVDGKQPVWRCWVFRRMHTGCINQASVSDRPSKKPT